jgi:hypothetical protein
MTSPSSGMACQSSKVSSATSSFSMIFQACVKKLCRPRAIIGLPAKLAGASMHSSLEACMRLSGKSFAFIRNPKNWRKTRLPAALSTA